MSAAPPPASPPPPSPTSPGSRARRSRGRRVGFALLAVAGALLASEGALRACGYPTGLVRRFRSVWCRDPAALARQPGLFRPGRWRIDYPPELAYGIAINALGLRGPEAPLETNPGRLRLLVLGDSVTFGFNVEDEETLPVRLEARLRARGRAVEVLNGGVGSFTIGDERRYLEERLLALRPRVVLLQFCANDVSAAELLRRPTRYEEMLADAQDAAPARLADLLRSTALGEAQLRLALWLKRPAEAAPGLGAPEEPPAAHWAAYEAELRGLRDRLRAEGIGLALCAMPDLHEVRAAGPSPWEARLSEIAARLELPFRGAVERFRRAEGGHERLYLWPRDPHLAPPGVDLLAEVAAETLEEAGLLGPP